MTEAATRQAPKVAKKKLQGYVGFANYPNQVHRRSVKKGFNFTLMVVGEAGIGKSTLINTLFNTRVFPDKDESTIGETRRGVEISSMSAEIQENGVRLRLTVVDTPGFGDSINNDDCWQPILENIESRFDAYLTQENRVNRSKISDNRIHALIYLIKPTGHALRAIDIEFMKRMHTKVNLIPVITKSDTLTQDELVGFKSRIIADINYHGIQIFKPQWESFEDPEVINENKDMLSKIPFAVIGSDKIIEKPDGNRVRGRLYPWGIIEVENEKHNDFIKLRKMLVCTHMEELKDVTDSILYENHRSQKLVTMGHEQDNTVFREYNPTAQMEEERSVHEARMSKMESEMTAVFQQKVQEKESKLKQSEEELYARHKEMKQVLEKQRQELEEKKKRLDSQTRPITPLDKKQKKGLFNLS
ncbi:Cell division control protein 3 [Zancudomyces culisetae]|uniref:Cell division control protein 3 n=1 Tax=Zancudomyces culisetae TaxID=1213189 RepID=A0A1R1PY44_ZANCU|nr:Cell division control protein 3 [Zancudomyces culisetae]|eukprot:OMH85837.1 Cell division control protein 3 [Zancudomyces culisetae]